MNRPYATAEALDQSADSKIKLESFETCDVLVIEDEIISSALIERYLKDLPKLAKNYGLNLSTDKLKVITLSSGWELLNKDLSNVKVAVVDLLLPQITGVDLIKDFVKRHPNLGLLPISGMATGPLKRNLREVLPQEIELVSKPLRKSTFYEAFAKAWKYHSMPELVVEAPRLNLVSNNPEEEESEEVWFEAHSDPSIKIPTETRRNLLKKKEPENSE